MSSSTFLCRFFHSLFLHEIVDRGPEQLRRSAKDLLRLIWNGRVDDLLVDAFRDALLGLGGVLQGQDEFLHPLHNLTHQTFLDDLHLPDLRLSHFCRWLFPWSQPPLQTGVHRCSNRVEGRDSLLLPLPSPPPSPPSPSPSPSSPDSVYSIFQVPSISSFQFQTRKSKISNVPDRNGGSQHNCNIAAEAMTTQGKH